jgi:hypothetical protein
MRIKVDLIVEEDINVKHHDQEISYFAHNIKSSAMRMVVYAAAVLE